eukprot:CAMPEP_0119155694 /NCGR_PEP_ID=MMETSP1310-20130426/51877_1 /TAXON_ID=464262 /ORGANISM="Genus nov. species nov., Strain RCC2339" /LENGTH=706 /DNA_ID=CAMNT_0007148295 /DNA_START=228 /DNA_END=2349 /DNA_ORIENTATION=+
MKWAVVVAVVVLVLGEVVWGEDIYVDNKDGSDTDGDGKTAGTAYQSISKGYAMATDGDRLLLVYNEEPYKPSEALAMGKLVSIVATGSTPVEVDLSACGTFANFVHQAAAADVREASMVNLIFSGGTGDYGALSVTGGGMNFQGVTFEANRGSKYGALVLFGANDGMPTLPVEMAGCQFLNNVNQGENGGAVTIVGGAELHIRNSLFQNNTCLAGDGGAISVGAEVVLRVGGSTFTSNAAGGRGGAINVDGQNKSEVRQMIYKSELLNNEAGTQGGALHADWAWVHVAGCRVVNNSLVSDQEAMGGGLCVTGALDMLGTLLEGNSILDNTGGSLGGGLYLRAIATASTLRSVILKGNLGETGADLYLAGGKLYAHRTGIVEVHANPKQLYFGGGSVANLDDSEFDFLSGVRVEDAKVFVTWDHNDVEGSRSRQLNVTTLRVVGGTFGTSANLQATVMDLQGGEIAGLDPTNERTLRVTSSGTVSDDAGSGDTRRIAGFKIINDGVFVVDTGAILAVGPSDFVVSDGAGLVLAPNSSLVSRDLDNPTTLRVVGDLDAKYSTLLNLELDLQDTSMLTLSPAPGEVPLLVLSAVQLRGALLVDMVEYDIVSTFDAGNVLILIEYKSTGTTHFTSVTSTPTRSMEVLYQNSRLLAYSTESGSLGAGGIIGIIIACMIVIAILGVVGFFLVRKYLPARPPVYASVFDTDNL